MSDSLVRLKMRLEQLERPRTREHGLFALGVEALDARLGGGLARGALHEVLTDGEASARGFALMLAIRAAVRVDQPILWVETDAITRAMGGLYAPGLVELGIDPDRLILIHAPDDLAALRVVADVMGCIGIGAAIIDAGAGKRLDLTASRKLVLAAERAAVTGIVLRKAGSSFASAASTRWQAVAAPSLLLAGEAPGHPALSLSLMRHRGGVAPFETIMEWDRDAQSFCEPPLPRAVLPLAGERALAADGERRAA